MKSNDKVYVVMVCPWWSDGAHPHSAHKSKLEAESVVILLEEDKDEDGYCNVSAYISEVDFYDQDA